MIVVVIIGLIAAIAVPNYLNFIRNAKVGRTASEMRSLSQGFVAFYASNGQYPPDSHASLPPGMSEYINPILWLNPTPIGGNYNWEGPDNYAYAGLSIFPADAAPLNELTMLDHLLDDGDLAQGNFRYGSNGRPTFIIEE